MLEALTSLFTLTVLEVVLSIDNLVVIAVLVGKLPKERQAAARYTGMTLALVPRLVLLLFIIVLAISSIGWGPIPGWWGKTFTDTYPIVNEAKPTIQFWPPSLGEHPFGQDTIGKDYFALVMRGLPVHEYTALQVKQAVVGKGKAAKEQVQHMVVNMLGLSGTPQSDAADGLAVALTHALRNHGLAGKITRDGWSVKRGRFHF